MKKKIEERPSIQGFLRVRVLYANVEYNTQELTAQELLLSGNNIVSAGGTEIILKMGSIERRGILNIFWFLNVDLEESGIVCFSVTNLIYQMHFEWKSLLKIIKSIWERHKREKSNVSALLCKTIISTNGL